MKVRKDEVQDASEWNGNNCGLSLERDQVGALEESSNGG